MKLNYILCLSGFLSLGILSAQAQDYTGMKIQRYRHWAKGQISLVPLEIGQITPEGWLRQWGEDAAKGITGHLDEYQPVYGNGWKGFGFKARGANETDGTGWPIEQCSYWLDGATKLAYILGDRALQKKVSDRLNIVVDGVHKGAGTFIWWKNDSLVLDGFNNWGHGIMGRALVSYYQATHQPRILEALNKVYSRYTMLSPTNQKGLESGLVRGSTNVDAMTETFLENGNKTILDSIIAYGNRPLVRQFGQRIMQMSDRSHKGFKTAHGVTFYEVSRVPAISSIWNGREEDRDVSLHLLSWAGKYNMLPFGLVSCEEYLSGTGPFHGVETCDIPASMWNYTWQMRIDGKGQWGDRIENVFFNAGPVSISRDWKTMSYYQMPNRFSEKLPADPAVPGPGDQQYTPYGHEVLCCVGSSNWEIPNYVTNMWMATMDHGLAYTLYGPCKVKALLDNVPVEIDCQTDYPFGDQIRIHLKSANDIAAPLYFRIPEWCGAMQIKVNGKKVAYKAYKGFAKIERKWRNGDAVVISLPMKASVTAGICTPYPRDNYFKRNPTVASNGNYYYGYTDSIAGEPYEYVKYGPLLYALPIKDIDENHVAEGQKYNYALGATLGKVKIIRKKMPERWTWKYEEAPVQLSVEAREFPWTPTDLAPLPKRKVTGGSAARITLVPYNCTKFHVSMFPVAD